MLEGTGPGSDHTPSPPGNICKRTLFLCRPHCPGPLLFLLSPLPDKPPSPLHIPAVSLLWSDHCKGDIIKCHWTTRILQAYPWVASRRLRFNTGTTSGQGFSQGTGRDRKGLPEAQIFPLDAWEPPLFLSLSAPGSLNHSPNLSIPRTQPFTFTQKQKHQHDLCGLPECTHPSLGLYRLLHLHPWSPLPSQCSVRCSVLMPLHAPSPQKLPALPGPSPLPHTLLICASLAPTYAPPSAPSPTPPGKDSREFCGHTVLGVTATESSLPCPAHICRPFCGFPLEFPSVFVGLFNQSHSLSVCLQSLHRTLLRDLTFSQDCYSVPSI